ncbi:phosphatidate cytidylyltransferase [Kangiella sp. HZ709]|uniref:phosphatidate cytidylyltransferase n=1 Tax=Kangiella sp. HZ709 TaxID=2666328 RepID=UPI0012AEF331|nr:phosphatidate cytidylyltransferase [Kangiella sp. HZ709]MRX28325.1 CDP-archaeol synthase [Kangiella sp. HZ709]
MFKQRVITALLLLPLAALLLFYPTLEIFSFILIPIFGLLAWEWSKLLETKYAVVQYGFIAGALAIVGFFCYQLFNMGFYETPNHILMQKAGLGLLNLYPFKALMVAALIWVLAFVLVLMFPKGSRLWTRGAALRMLFGWVMLAAAWLAIVLIRSSQYEIDTNYGGFLLLLMFFVIWGADVGAYLAGKTFGKNKLAPVVSPNKTWEGFFGGLITSFLVAWALGTYMGLPLPLKYFIPFVLILGIVSVIGDLFVSMLKRQAKIKDTSNILPGHGGLLDRLDSTLSVAPFFVVLLLWLKGGF